MLFSLCSADAADHAAVERQFQAWLAGELWPAARKLGVSKATFEAAFKGVKLDWRLPGLVPPGEKLRPPKIQRQAEFRSPAAYFAPNALNAVVRGGRARAAQYAHTLAAVERRYGVPGAIVLAIWGRESGFGSAALRYDAFRVLGTKAFMSLRKDMFRGEALAALEIVQRGYISVDAMKSSWAGALGQPQFMPTSFLRNAVDFDGDGKRDIWHSAPDTLASIAHYLARHGWTPGRAWGYEVTAPASVSCALEGPDRGKKIAEWEAMGVSRVGGKAFPPSERGKIGFLMMPAGRFGPAFIVTPNFYVLKDYNNSDLYALFIGHAADRIRYGDVKFAGKWGDVGGLYRSDIAAMQRRMEKLGYDVGGADGFPGFKTRRAIGEWQKSHGRSATCFPDARLLRDIR